MNLPAQRRDDQMILEGVVTTRNADGSVNVSPMGPVVDRAMDAIRLRPFNTSTTYHNLVRERSGIFHVTDDVMLIAQTAIGLPVTPLADPEEPVGMESLRGLVLANACRWYAFDVLEIDDTDTRVEVSCRVISRGRLRDFVGWNRAMHAVLEAAILATRVKIMPADELLTQMESLATIVGKTSSETERSAFALLSDFIASATSDD